MLHNLVFSIRCFIHLDATVVNAFMYERHCVETVHSEFDSKPFWDLGVDTCDPVSCWLMLRMPSGMQDMNETCSSEIVSKPF